jgi:glycosyltransferase involved in cell wall biosynthesis
MRIAEVRGTRRVKVAQFIDTHGVGGAEAVVVELSCALRDEGHDVEVWHFGNRWLTDRLEELAITAVPLTMEQSYKRVVTLPWFWIYARRLLIVRNIGALHTHLLGACFAWAIPSWIAGVRHVATLHDAYSLVASRKSRTMVQLASRFGTHLAGVSKEVCDVLGDWVPGAQVSLVLNGIREPSVADGRRTAVRTSRGVSESEVVFAAVGRLVRIKRHDLMIAAFLDPFVPRIARLWIIGDGPLREELEARVRNSGLGDRVSFLGELADVSEILAASDAMLSASDSEGLSMALIEGLAAGLPLIATAVGGNNVIIDDQRNGYLVTPGSEQALCGPIRELTRNSIVRSEMGGSSFEKFTAQFRSHVMAKHYAALYSRDLS